MDLSFSLDQLTQIVRKLRGSEESVFDGLDTLSNLLIYGGGQNLSRLPVQDLCKLLVNILRTSTRIKYKEMAALCIYNVLEVHPASFRFFVQSNLIKVLDQIITPEINGEFAENCINAFSNLAKITPEDIGKQVGISCFLRCFNNTCPATQRTALTSILMISSKVSNPVFCTNLPTLASIIANGEERCALLAAQCFLSISQQNSVTLIPDECIDQLIIGIPKINDGNVVVSILTVFTSMIEKEKKAANFLPHMNFFDDLCNNEATKIRRVDIIGKLLEIIVMVTATPPFSLPQILWKYEKNISNDAKEFSIKIQPLLLKLYSSRVQCEDLLLLALASSNCYAQFKIDGDFVTTLIGLSQDVRIIPHIVAFILSVKDLKPIVDSGIIVKIDVGRLPKMFKQWVGRSLTKLKKRAGIEGTDPKKEQKPVNININKIEDIIELSKSSLSPFEMISTGAAQKVTTFLRTRPLKSLSKEFVAALQSLADSMKTALAFNHFPMCSDPLASEVESFSEFSYPIDIIYEDHKFEDISVDLSADLVAIESYVNQQVFKNVNEANLRKAMQKGDMSGLIYPAENAIRSCSVFGYLARSFNMQGYKKFMFTIKGKNFPAQEPLWHVLSTVYSSIDELLDNKPVFVLQQGDCPRPVRKPHAGLPSGFDVPIQLISTIHNVCHEVDCESKQLTDIIVPHLAAPSLTAGLYSEAISLFYNYPFLFTFEARSLAFKLSGFDLPAVLHTITTTFTDINDRRRLSTMRMKIHANRAKIMEDGKKVLAKLPGTLRIEVDFVGEMGVGVGPTQEFYTLLSREFCRPSVGLWRNEDPSSEFCYCKKGLFPSPAASPKDMRLFGILCAKALAASCLIDVPLSDAFFRVLKGERISIDDVDETFAQSLKAKEGLIGLDFTYPGLPNFELKRGGSKIDVTEANVKEYVKLITDYTVGSGLRNILDAFRQGFSSVIPFESTILFQPSEMSVVLCGFEEKWTVESLQQNVGLEHGYTAESKEIKILFEVLSEMEQDQRMLFLKFVTGSTRLPIGGLGALRPKLTVARKDEDDTHLPSVMTCTNYFKMPPYSTKEIMKEKILTAISEGQGAFSFS